MVADLRIGLSFKPCADWQHRLPSFFSLLRPANILKQSKRQLDSLQKSSLHQEATILVL